MQPDGTDVRQLTTGRFIDQSPSWSPDGAGLVFSRVAPPGSPDHPMPVQPLLRRCDGTGLNRLTRCPSACDGGYDVRPCGPRTARGSRSSARAGEAGPVAHRCSGWRPTVLRRGVSRTWGGARMGAGGTRIALAGGTARGIRGRPAGRREEWGSVVRTIALPSLGLIESVSWSPDGRMLTSAPRRPRPGRRPACTCWTSPSLSRSPGCSSTAARTAGAATPAPAWSPDGKQIVFVRGPGGYSAGQVWVVSSNGTDQRQLTDGSLLDSSPAWQPET